MVRTIKTVFIALITLVTVGCSADLSDYKETSPSFDLFGYFDGQVTAWGMVQDYTDKQTRRFEVEIVGTVSENQLTLVEDFIFNDGEKSRRVWEITRLSDGTFQGTADDIDGIATGRVEGNALRWQYDFDLKMDDSVITVAFDDWLYQQDERHVFNLTKIKKFGVEVGTLTIFFQKHLEK